MHPNLCRSSRGLGAPSMRTRLPAVRRPDEAASAGEGASTCVARVPEAQRHQGCHIQSGLLPFASYGRMSRRISMTSLLHASTWTRINQITVTV
eukprot:366226-Chlamydomonas_euryale.AAC.2